jgi:hypothetical protein
MTAGAGELEALVAKARAVYPATQLAPARERALPTSAIVIVVAAWSGPAWAALTFVARTVRDADTPRRCR